MAKEQDYNQTSFSQDRPLYETEVEVPVDEPEAPDLDPVHKPWYQRRMVWVITGIVVLFVIFVIIFVASNNGQQPSPEMTPEEQEEMLEQGSDPFVNRINQLETELKAADPTKPKLIFPPVDLEIRLDQPE